MHGYRLASFLQIITVFQVSLTLDNRVHCRLGGIGLSCSSVSDSSTSVAIVSIIPANFRQCAFLGVIHDFLDSRLQRKCIETVVGANDISDSTKIQRDHGASVHPTHCRQLFTTRKHSETCGITRNKRQCDS